MKCRFHSTAHLIERLMRMSSAKRGGPSVLSIRLFAPGLFSSHTASGLGVLLLGLLVQHEEHNGDPNDVEAGQGANEGHGHQATRRCLWWRRWSGVAIQAWRASRALLARWTRVARRTIGAWRAISTCRTLRSAEARRPWWSWWTHRSRGDAETFVRLSLHQRGRFVFVLDFMVEVSQLLNGRSEFLFLGRFGLVLPSHVRSHDLVHLLLAAAASHLNSVCFDLSIGFLAIAVDAGACGRSYRTGDEEENSSAIHGIGLA